MEEATKKILVVKGPEKIRKVLKLESTQTFGRGVRKRQIMVLELRQTFGREARKQKAEENV